jgi:hypothetical protein
MKKWRKTRAVQTGTGPTAAQSDSFGMRLLFDVVVVCSVHWFAKLFKEAVTLSSTTEESETSVGYVFEGSA